MSLLDDSAALDQTTPWAPTVPLAPPPEATPQPAVKPGKITPETHPGYFNAPAAGGALAGPQPAASGSPAAAQPAGGDYMATVRRRESGGNDMAGNGTAFGRYQFTQRTWLGVAAAHPELGLRPEDIWNGDKQDQAMKALTADNSRVLQKEGFDPTPSNLYMMHFLGTAGGPKFLKAMQVEPTTNAAALFPLEAKYNPTIFFHGGDPNQPRNLSQIYGMMTKDFDGTAFDATQTKSVENSQPQVASDAISDATNDASAPPLPPGAKLVPMDGDTKAAASEAPPLPPGAKMVPFDPQEAYAQDVGKNNPYGKSPDASEKPLSFWEAASPGRFFQAREDLGKGVASGATQGVLGVAENVPGAIGQGAAEADKTLEGVGAPIGQSIGGALVQSLPLAKGAEAAGAGVKAFTEAAPWAGKIAEAAGWSGLFGAAQPTGETDPTNRAEKKLTDIAVTGVMGGVGAAGIPSATSLVKKGYGWAAKEVSDIWGGEAERLSKELREGVNAETGKVLSEKERTAKIAQIDKLNAKTQAAGEESSTVAQEKKAAEAETARQAKVSEIAARPTTPPEKLGAEASEVMAKDVKAAKDTRRADSGFDAAVKSDHGLPSIDTKAAISRIADIEKRFDVDLGSLKSKLATKPVVKGGPTVSSVSIERGRDFVENLNTAAEGSTSQVKHELIDIRNEFVEHMETTHPDLKTARMKYADLSRDVDIYERKGKLAKAAESDLYSGEPVTDAVKIKNLITDQTEEGGKALERLISVKPELKETVKQALDFDLPKVPDSKALDRLIKNKRITLEKSGLMPEYEAMRDGLKAAEETAETEAGKAKELRSASAADKPGSRKTQQNISDLASTKAKATAARSDIRRLEIEMNEPKNTPKQIVSAAESTAKKLYDRGSISEAQYQKFFSAVREAEAKNADHEHAVRLAKMVGAAVAVGVMGEEAGRYLQHRISVR